MVEPQPSKLMMWVRSPSPAPIYSAFVVTNAICAHIAQSVEHFLGKEEVTGSNPVMSSSIEVEHLRQRLKGLCKLNIAVVNIAITKLECWNSRLEQHGCVPWPGLIGQKAPRN